MTAIGDATVKKEASWLLRPAVLDRIEQVAILLLWSWFAYRVMHADNTFTRLALISETSIAVFSLIRRPTQNISVRLGDWLLAITATLAPLLIVPNAPPIAPLLPVAFALVVFGNLFQIWAKLTLRRSFGVAPANRGVKANGAYRIVRHPMYAGYLLNHIGIFLITPSPINFSIYGICWYAQILRLKAEEELLSQDPAYVAFKEKVRWRLIPGVF